jgi:aerobic-type carbon monoxide dehydrogenase small subunit (CoxS/CutS family)
MITLNVNGKPYPVEVDPATPLLWVLREQLQLTGAKYACGMGVCGNCMVLVEGEAVTSCNLPVADVVNKSITTIEGLAQNAVLHPVQQAWIDENVPECGYCQSGQILNAVSMLNKHPAPSELVINQTMSAVLCRCGTYARIRKAIQRVVQSREGK